MSNPYLGEIRPFAGTFAPRGWHFCDGSLLSIAQWSALFSLLGTTYGGDGQTTFGVPDLRGRTAVGQGQGPGLTNRTLGEMSGTEEVTVLIPQMPGHMHAALASTATATTPSPNGNMLAAPANNGLFYLPPNIGAPIDAPLPPDTVGQTGGTQPHDNIMPTLGISYIIAMQGIFPSRN